jgi:chemotaxis protein MotB
MARKKKHEEHENHERWLVSYADFITLLFAFFVVMYSISSINEGKYRVLSNSLVSAFGNSAGTVAPIKIGEPVKIPIPDPIQTPGPSLAANVPNSPAIYNDNKEKAAMKRMADNIEKDLSELIKKDLINVKRNRNSVEVEMNTSILFPSGSAAIQHNAVATLQKLAKILKDNLYNIQVRGFTDNIPINTVAFPSNWELSAARAASVVRIFMNSGVEPHRMAAVGFGQYRPNASNATPQGRRKNRRVVVVIFPDANIKGTYDELRSFN